MGKTGTLERSIRYRKVETSIFLLSGEQERSEIFLVRSERVGGRVSISDLRVELFKTVFN